VQDVLLALGRGRKGIRPGDLDFLMEIMIKSGHLDDLQLAGLSADRVQVFPGGLAILAEVLSSLDVDRMVVAEGALREGILHDMLGRLADEDARSRTVRALQARFRIDVAQARRVGTLAQKLRREVADQWDLERESAALLLGWSAALHELGLDIAHAHHHYHSAYVLEHADMPGFSREEQRLLATLVRCHRRKFGLETFTPLPSEWRVRALRLTVLLRLAVLFNRGRIGVSVPLLAATASDDTMRLVLPAAWLRDNPLTEADLRREQTHLAAVGIRLTITRRRD
jgi:exopolyphosphatase/guanosine-5'-triphosphate,3'-diphosphate pyrophosphatase